MQIQSLSLSLSLSNLQFDNQVGMHDLGMQH